MVVTESISKAPLNRPTVVVLDYGAGNVHSAVRALEEAGAHVILSKDLSLIHI